MSNLIAQFYKMLHDKEAFNSIINNSYFYYYFKDTILFNENKDKINTLYKSDLKNECLSYASDSYMLDPCPFCGSKPLMIKRGLSVHSTDAKYKPAYELNIECVNSQCSVNPKTTKTIANDSSRDIDVVRETILKWQKTVPNDLYE